MKLFVAPPAQAELFDAISYYSLNVGAKVAFEFIAEFERAANLILHNPLLGAKFRGAQRRFALRRFPFTLFYQFDHDTLRILAVAHQRRRPGYWQKHK